MSHRRRLAVLALGLLAVSGIGAVPTAQATSPAEAGTSVAVRDIGCVWVDALDISVCLSG